MGDQRRHKPPGESHVVVQDDDDVLGPAEDDVVQRKQEVVRGETMTSTPGKCSRVKATLASVLRLSTSRTGHGLPSSDAAASAVDRQS